MNSNFIRATSASTTIQHERPMGASPDCDMLTLYLRDIGLVPLLSREDEASLARRIRAGDLEARDSLVRANLRFVVAVAMRYRHRGVLLSDLIDEGNLGLIRAAEKFDETRGIRFVAYAVWWIRRAIADAIAEQSHIVRVPRHAYARDRGVASDATPSNHQTRWEEERIRIAMRTPRSLECSH